jgi:hypothetical protein
MSTIKSSTTTTTAYQVVADTTGALVIQTGATPTTAVTIGADQSVTFAGAVSTTGNQTLTGNLTVNGNTTLGDASTDTVLMTGAPSIGGAGLGMGMGFRNRIINGAMVIDQRNAGASVTVNTDYTYGVDRFSGSKGNSASNFTMQQSTTVPTGFKNSLLFTMGTGVPVSTANYSIFSQAIEGQNLIDFNLGTASSVAFTLSFWVRSSVTGTFGVSFRNSAALATYCSTYTISSANTFEYKTVTVPAGAINSGTWLTTNGIGVNVFWDLGVGSVYSGTANQLNTGANYFGVTGTTKLSETTGATFYVTGVQLEKGSTATAFDYLPYGTELQLCQRYCNVFTNSETTNQRHSTFAMAPSTTGIDSAFSFKASMRTAPSVLIDTIGNLRLSDGISVVTPTSYAIMSAVNGAQQGLVSFATTGLTAFRPYFVEANGTLNSAKIIFSAEL